MSPRVIALPTGPGLLVRPPRATALYVLAHGAGAGMRHDFMDEIAALLAARRIATLRWEFPFMVAGKARVDAAPIAEAAVRETFAAATRHARGLPMFAGGKSFGGRMTSRAHAAAALPGARGLAFLGFPLHPANRPGTERADHLASAAGPLLFVQGTRDALADLALLRPVVTGLGPRAELHEVLGADHGFTRGGFAAPRSIAEGRCGGSIDRRVRDGGSAAARSQAADILAAWMAAHR